jgi:hypothetical protein
MNEYRGPWYLLTGLIIGLVLGFIYAKWVSPVEYESVDPSTLNSENIQQYRLMIAQAYGANGDLVRAKARLSLLGDRDPGKALIEQAQQILAENGPLKDAQALGVLASALSQKSATDTP